MLVRRTISHEKKLDKFKKDTKKRRLQVTGKSFLEKTHRQTHGLVGGSDTEVWLSGFKKRGAGGEKGPGGGGNDRKMLARDIMAWRGKKVFKKKRNAKSAQMNLRRAPLREAEMQKPPTPTAVGL